MALMTGWGFFCHLFLIVFFTTILLPLIGMSDLKPQHGLHRGPIRLQYLTTGIKNVWD